MKRQKTRRRRRKNLGRKRRKSRSRRRTSKKKRSSPRRRKRCSLRGRSVGQECDGLTGTQQQRRLNAGEKEPDTLQTTKAS